MSNKPIYYVHYCRLCDLEIRTKSPNPCTTKFKQHLLNEHNIDNYIDYLADAYFGGIIPKCKNPNCNNNVVMSNSCSRFDLKLSEFCHYRCVPAGKLTDSDFSKRRSEISSKTMCKTWSTDEFKLNHKDKMTRLWNDPDYYNKMYKVLTDNNAEFWKDDNKVKNFKNGGKNSWNNPKRREEARKVRVKYLQNLSKTRQKYGGFSEYEYNLKEILNAHKIEFVHEKRIELEQFEKDKFPYPRYRFFLDFYLPKYNLIIELDGENHSSFDDKIRDDILKNRGYLVIRITNKEFSKLNEGEIIDMINRCYKENESISYI